MIFFACENGERSNTSFIQNHCGEITLSKSEALTHTLKGIRPTSPARQIRTWALNPLLAPLVSAFFILAGAPPTVSASAIFFTNQTLYNTALTADGLSTSSFNFNSTPVQSYATAAGLTIDGVNFVSPEGNGSYYLVTAPPNFCCNDYTNPNESLQASAISSSFYGIPNGSTTITLPVGTSAFSLTAFTVQAGDYTNSGHDTLNLSVNGSIGQTTTSTNSGTGFIGFISTTPVTSAVLKGSTPEDFIDIINGSVSAPASVSGVPEPSGWSLMIVAGLLVGCARCYREWIGTKKVSP